jgi:acyl-lipid omega-6 desaturase (Delta-12 desaturase)
VSDNAYRSALVTFATPLEAPCTKAHWQQRLSGSMTPAEAATRPARARIAPDWNAAVAPYVGADTSRSLIQLVTTLSLLVLSLVVMYQAMSWSIIALVLALPTAGLMVRTFIIMHDCAHGSFLPWRRVSDGIGFITGVLTFTPFAQWRRDHALHHASSGDLDRRGHGDVPTLTVREYLAKSPRQRLVYRTIRHPLSLMLVGPFHLILGQRFRSRSKATRSRQMASVWGTNAAITVLAALGVWAFGWRALLLVYLPSYYVAAMAGVWLFYVQHQFEDAHWESHDDWDYATAALRGSSHLQLTPVLQWFTGNIGLHHVHHLAPRIPNYRLQQCHDATPLMQTAPVVTIRTGVAALRLALWDEDLRRLRPFAEVDGNDAVTRMTASHTVPSDLEQRGNQ